MSEVSDLDKQIRLAEGELQLQAQEMSLKKVETELLRLDMRKRNYAETLVGLHKAIEETKQRVEVLLTNKK